MARDCVMPRFVLQALSLARSAGEEDLLVFALVPVPVPAAEDVVELPVAELRH